MTNVYEAASPSAFKLYDLSASRACSAANLSERERERVLPCDFIRLVFFFFLLAFRLAYNRLGMAGCLAKTDIMSSDSVATVSGNAPHPAVRVCNQSVSPTVKWLLCVCVCAVLKPMISMTFCVARNLFPRHLISRAPCVPGEWQIANALCNTIYRFSFSALSLCPSR